MSFSTDTALPKSAVLTQKKLSLALLCVLMTSLSACSTFKKSNKVAEHPPAKLVQISQGQNVLSKVMSADVGGKSAMHMRGHTASLNPKHFFGKKDKVARNQSTANYIVASDAQGYIATSPNGNLIAYNLQGRKQWEVEKKSGFAAGVAIDSTSSTVVVSDNDAHLVAYDRATGKQRWQTSLTGSVLAPSLIVDNRVISLSNDGVVNGISLQTGEPIWQFATQTPTISVRGSASPILLDSKTALVATADGRIHAIDIDNGVPLWSRRIAVTQGASEIDRLTDIDATPVLSDNMLYVISYSGQLVGIDMAGRQINFLEKYASLKSVAADKTQLYVTTLDGEVIAMDKYTGKINWQTDSLKYRGLSNPIAINGKVVIGDAEGYLHVLESTTGREIDRKQDKNAVANLKLNNNQIFSQSPNGDFSVWRVN